MTPKMSSIFLNCNRILSFLLDLNGSSQGEKGDVGPEGAGGDRGEIGLKGKEGTSGPPGLVGVRVSVSAPNFRVSFSSH